MKWLITFLVLTLVILGAKAEELTTDNLLPNTGNGVDWGSNSTDQINPGSSGYVNNGDVVNGFTITCPESQANCGYKHSTGGDFEVTGTATVSVDDIDLTSNTITQDMLDNGITLNSYIDVANCDSKPGNCEGKSGDADSHTVVIELKDLDGNVLSTTTQTRVGISGFQGNCNGYPHSNSGGQTADCGQYNDQVIYNDTGSNKVDWSWSGTDNNNSSSSLGGPNLLGAKLTMTYDSSLLDEEIIDEIDDVFEDIEDVFEYIEFTEIEELFEEFIPSFQELPMEEEISFEPVLMLLEEMPVEEEIIEEEIIEEFVMEEESIMEEEMLEEEAIAEEFVEEEFTEEEIVEEEPTKLAEEPNEKEEVKEEKPTSKTTKTANVKDKNNKKQKNIQPKETIKNNLVKIMDKVDKDIKDISKNLQIKNIIKLDAMANDQVSLDLYDVPFYKSKDIYLDQIQIQDLRQIYDQKTLVKYTATDPINIVNEKLNKISIKKKRLLIELEQLKNG